MGKSALTESCHVGDMGSWSLCRARGGSNQHPCQAWQGLAIPRNDVAKGFKRTMRGEKTAERSPGRAGPYNQQIGLQHDESTQSPIEERKDMCSDRGMIIPWDSSAVVESNEYGLNMTTSKI